MKKALLIFSISLVAILSSYKKENNSIELNNPKSLASTAGFDWKSFRNVNFSVEIADSRFANELHMVSIYKGDPGNGGQLLTRLRIINFKI